MNRRAGDPRVVAVVVPVRSANKHCQPWYLLAVESSYVNLNRLPTQTITA